MTSTPMNAARSLVPAAALLVAACSGTEGEAPGASASGGGRAAATDSGGSASAPGPASTATSSGAPAAGGAAQTAPPVLGGTTGGFGGGFGGAPSAGSSALPGGRAAAAPPSSGGSPAAGGVATGAPATGGSPEHVRDHCVEGYAQDAADLSMASGPAEYTKGGQVDLTVQPEVIAWMEANVWQEAHFQWHNVRRCNGGGSMVRNGFDPCKYTEIVPSDQECRSDGDGFQFLVMHRHMIQSLKQLFPNHAADFAAFPSFPQRAEDVPEQWRASFSAFSQMDLANAKVADEIDKPENLSRFPSEGAFGRWLQCFAPTYSGLHGDLHFKWVRTSNTEHGLGNQFRNIDNYMFWKMHGWIDDVWEKYRLAKGLAPDDPALKDALIGQCREMDKLATLIDPSLAAPNPSQDLPTESGVFHEKIRPIFATEKNKCTGCHSDNGPEARLVLGGNVSSAAIVAGLVNKPTATGGQFRLVVPGKPLESWLYLKASGQAAAAGCVETQAAICRTQVMPPEASQSVTLDLAELEALREWIESGAL